MIRFPARARGPLVAALLLAGCSSSREHACPGAPVAVLDLAATLDPAQTRCDGGEPAGGWAAQVPASVVFAATLSEDAASSTAALCTGRALASDLTGARSGDDILVSATTEGAVLGACAATCAARLTVIVEGKLVPPAVPGGPPDFQGTLVERMDPAGGACGACVLPCTATYALSGTAR